MFVAEAPGENEEEQGKPLVGVSGKHFNGWLKKAGIKREECVIANTFTYRPFNNKVANFFITPRNAKQNGIAISENRPLFKGKALLLHFDLEVARLYMSIVNEYKPKVIVSMGAISTWSILGKDNISELVGTPVKHEVKSLRGSLETIIIPTYHPTYAAVYNRQYEPEMAIAFKKARKLAKE